MTLQPDNEIAALFDPNFDELEPAIVPPGALPPSWAAAMAANRAAATPAPAQELAWSQAPGGSIAAPAPVVVPSPAPDAERGPTGRGK